MVKQGIDSDLQDYPFTVLFMSVNAVDMIHISFLLAVGYPCAIHPLVDMLSSENPVASAGLRLGASLIHIDVSSPASHG